MKDSKALGNKEHKRDLAVRVPHSYMMVAFQPIFPAQTAL